MISTSVLSSGGGALFLFIYNVFFSKNILAGLELTEILLVVLFFPVNLLTTFLSSILLGKQQLLAYNSVDVARIYANLIFQIISSLLGFRVMGALTAWLLSNLVAFMLAGWYLQAELSQRPSLEKAILKPALSYGVKNYTSNLLTFFNYRLDTFFVNNFSGMNSVGQYSTSVAVAELLWYIPNSISSALFPKISSGEVPNPTELTARICRLVLLVTLPGSVLFGFLGVYAIPVLYSAQFQASVTPFLWLLPGVVAVSVTKVISADLSGRGMPQYSTYISIVTLVVTLVLDFVLIPRYAIIGAAVASSVAYITSSLLSLVWFTCVTGVRVSVSFLFEKPILTISQ